MSDVRPTGRISLRISGGFAHLPRAAEGWTVDLDDLTDADLAALRTAILAADFFDRPERAVSPSVRDGRTYGIAIEMDGQSRTLEAREPFEDQTLADLVGVVRGIVTR